MLDLLHPASAGAGKENQLAQAYSHRPTALQGLQELQAIHQEADRQAEVSLRKTMPQAWSWCGCLARIKPAVQVHGLHLWPPVFVS